MSCTCQNSTTPSTCCICGNFSIPTVPDEGQCFPYRVKRDCEAPVVPGPPCPGESYTTIYQPEDSVDPFKVSATLRDENCAIITDENNQPILTFIT